MRLIPEMVGEPWAGGGVPFSLPRLGVWEPPADPGRWSGRREPGGGVPLP